MLTQSIQKVFEIIIHSIHSFPFSTLFPHNLQQHIHQISWFSHTSFENIAYLLDQGLGSHLGWDSIHVGMLVSFKMPWCHLSGIKSGRSFARKLIMPKRAPNLMSLQAPRIWVGIQSEFRVGLKFGIWRQKPRWVPDVHASFPVSGLGLAAKIPAPFATTGTLRYKVLASICWSNRHVSPLGPAVFIYQPRADICDAIWHMWSDELVGFNWIPLLEPV